MLENFETADEEKRYGQVVQLIGRMERKQQHPVLKYRQWWDKLWFKTPPEKSDVSTLAEKLRARIRKSNFMHPDDAKDKVR